MVTHPRIHITINADQVGAYLWSRANMRSRQSWCAMTGIVNIGDRGWYELEASIRTALVNAMATEIETTAAHLRAATPQEAQVDVQG